MKHNSIAVLLVLFSSTLCISESEFGKNCTSLRLFAQLATLSSVPEPLRKHCQRHNGPEGWVLITSSNTNLDQISSSESRPSIIFKISTKHQPLHKTWSSKSWPNLASESWPRYEWMQLQFHWLSVPITKWGERVRFPSTILAYSSLRDNSVLNIFYSLSQCVCVGSATAAPPPTRSTLCGYLLSLRSTKIQLHNLNQTSAAK